MQRIHFAARTNLLVALVFHFFRISERFSLGFILIKTFSTQDIQFMPQRYRAQFVNSLSGFKSANLIGTIDSKGHTNLAMISSVFHLGADPALMGFISRPHSVPRHTLENLQETGFYTINHCNSLMFRQGHQTSARYPKEVSEFQATGLTEFYGNVHAAPYVQESKLRIGLKFLESTTLHHNQTVLVIGEIIEVQLPEGVMTEDGQVMIETLDTVCVSGLDRYHQTKEIARLPYAKP